MSDLEALKKQIEDQRKGGKRNYHRDIKIAVVKAAEKHGPTVVVKSLEVHPSTFYKWQKQYNRTLKKSSSKKKSNSLKTEFLEIDPSNFKSEPPKKVEEAKFKTQIKWEAVRPDGSLLRCELSGNGADIGAVFNNFLNGGKLL